MRQYASAEHYYLQSAAILSDFFPESIQLAISLRNIGYLYSEMGQYAEAEKHYFRSILVFKSHYQKSFHYAICLEKLGYLYIYEEKVIEAREVITEAMGIYEEQNAATEVANCWSVLQRIGE
jgi:tetratricopeptide (TPR) repeat protein